MIKTREELIEKYIAFFKSKGHKEIPGASLVPTNDPTVLFTTAGMHPLVPYLLGEKHPLGKRLVDVQKCIRTGDIEEVGDEVHHTFFEMLGNWSLGDYFKKEAIEFSFEFLTKELKIPLERFAVTVFAGDKDAPRDDAAAKIWQSLGISKDRIAFLEKKDNWWGPAGDTGPCGPDTEMFYWKDNKERAPKKFNPKEKRWVEIWNDVLMQYNKDKNGKYIEANQKNIDTGMGVERTLAVLHGLEDNYLGECFLPIIKEIEKISGKRYGQYPKETQHIRIIADHIKASVFIIADGVTPSNTERGYVLRRLIRRAVRYGHVIEIKRNFTTKLVDSIIGIYSNDPKLRKGRNLIMTELDKEENKFNKTLEESLRIAKNIFSKKTPIRPDKINKLRNISREKTEEIMEKLIANKRSKKNYAIKEAGISEEEIDKALITGREAFYLYQSFGFPIDMIIDLAIEYDLLIDRAGFEKENKKHQELSRAASTGVFKGGLADNTDATKKLHTATHLLNEALRVVLKDDSIKQKGSNINPERLRFDFNFPRKLEPSEVKAIEEWINNKIKQKIPIERKEMKLSEALKSGAQAEFGAKYPSVVSVYSIGSASKEICTGPHVNNTSQLGKFKIIKEESSASGIRRIKAELLDSNSD